MILKLINILLVLVYAFGSGIWVSTGDSWYRELNAPTWQPPDWVFGVIWPYNFIALGIAGWLVASNLNKGWVTTWLSIFAVSIICALTWANLFYVHHKIGEASIALSLVAMLTLPLLTIAFKANWKVGLALLPYQAWVTTATFLSFGYKKLN